MLISLEDCFSDNQGISATGATLSENTLDWGRKGPDLNSRFHIYVQVTDKGNLGSSAIQAKFQMSDNKTDWVDVATSQEFSKSDVEDGTILLDIPLPERAMRYARVLYALPSAATTAVKVFAGLVPGGGGKVGIESVPFA